MNDDEIFKEAVKEADLLAKSPADWHAITRICIRKARADERANNDNCTSARHRQIRVRVAKEIFAELDKIEIVEWCAKLQFEEIAEYNAKKQKYLKVKTWTQK